MVALWGGTIGVFIVLSAHVWRPHPLGHQRDNMLLLLLPLPVKISCRDLMFTVSYLNNQTTHKQSIYINRSNHSGFIRIYDMKKIGEYYHGEIWWWNKANFDNFSHSDFLEKLSFLTCSNSGNSKDIMKIPLHMHIWTPYWSLCKFLWELDIYRAWNFPCYLQHWGIHGIDPLTRNLPKIGICIIIVFWPQNQWRRHRTSQNQWRHHRTCRNGIILLHFGGRKHSICRI